MSKTTIRAAFAALCTALAAFTAYAVDTTIEINSVAQRWPWNNKVDITYTVTGGQELATSNFCKVVFTTMINGTSQTIDGSTLGASAAAGQHTVTWIAPDGIRCDNCTMSATISTADAPSGNDYMIIDLASGAITYEGLYATQAESNSRYNTDTYKTDKLVLRKISAGGPYRVTKTRTRTTDRDYYIGIFSVTRGQFALIGGYSADGVATVGNKKPMTSVCWDDLRLSTTAATSSIPTVATADTGTFFQRLMYKTGNRLAFDLPTEMMFALAARAGVTTTYFWDSDEMDVSKIVCKENGNAIADVGTCDANNWGLYDVQGNVWEFALDSYRSGAHEDTFGSSRPNVFIPYYDPAVNLVAWVGGASYSTASTIAYFQLDRGAGDLANNKSNGRGNDRSFRVSVIMD